MDAINLCIIADTHGYIDPRILALANHCDYVLHAGDIGSAAILKALHPRRKVYAVRGNNDVSFKWREEEHETLHALQWVEHIELPGGSIALEHGHQVNPVTTRHAKLRQRHPKARAIVYGHSHIMLVDDAEPIWVLNPGASGKERTKGGPSCLMLDIMDGQWRIQPIRFAKR